MLSLDGYAIWDRIHATDHSEVYTGARERDGLRVVLKVYRKAGSGDKHRAECEFELLERIDAEGVVRPVELRADGERQVLIVERFPGFPLSRYARNRRFSPEEFLRIALPLTRALAGVHEARIIHKDIKLGNVLIDPKRSAICLIDFGISSEFGRAERIVPPRVAEGTIRYIAPEQTGRMGSLGVDFRTDLYSLGASFYELLTGQPPFRGRSGMELIAAHISLQPKPPVDIDSRIPLTLSRIIEKLLKKDPDRRYQTARGLAADLEECQKQLHYQGHIDDELALGAHDASDQLRFSRQLYGRAREQAELQAAFERVAQKGVEVVLISGPAGIGKSTLAGVLRSRLAQGGGYLAEAKFDPELRARPYTGFQTAFSSLIDQILSESRERIAMWRDELRAELGGLGGVVAELAPGLHSLIEDMRPVEPLPAREARQRLALATVRFVRTMASRAHPLVLFLDDLQWVDSGSLFLLEALLRSGEPESLLVIGGYRDAEVSADHPFTRLFERLEEQPLPVLHLPLAPLGLEDTTAMLAEALSRSPAETEWLARRVGPKSQHNPLLLRRLMFHLWDRDLIRYEHGVGWVWDQKQLTEADITDDAAAMVATRIDALPSQTQGLLRTASLIGRTFDLEMLVALAQVDRLDVLQQLMKLVDLGLIAPCQEGFKFVHDRLREAAQSRLTGTERAALHRRAARLMLDRTPEEALPAVSFQLAEHLGGAVEQLTEPERPRAIEIFRVAARQALAKGAPESAVQQLDLAKSLLCEADWESRNELAYTVELLAAEATFQTLAFDRALEILDHLVTRPLRTSQRTEVMAKRISFYSLLRPADATDLALDALRSLGVRWSRDPSRWRTSFEILRTDWLLRGPIDERTFPIQGVQSAAWLEQLMIIASAASSFSHVSQRLSLLCAAHVLRGYQRYGCLTSPSQALAGYAGARAAVRRDRRGLARYVSAVAYWLEREKSPRSAVRAQVILHAFVRSWLGSRRSVLAPLEDASEQARSVGDLEFLAYATHQHVMLSAVSGERLSELAPRIERMKALDSTTRGSYYADVYAFTYGWLDGTCSGLDLEPIRERLVASGRPNAEVYVAIHWIVSLYLLGHLKRAAEESERLARQVFTAGMVGTVLVDYTFYRGLCQAGLAEGAARRADCRRPLEILRECTRRLRSWARTGPDFAHMARLLEAESYALRRRTASALAAYQDAAQGASRCGYTHHAALCHERRAQLLDREHRGMEAGSAVSEAIDLYRQWGAHTKVEQLQARLGPDGVLRSR